MAEPIDLYPQTVMQEGSLLHADLVTRLGDLGIAGDEGRAYLDGIQRLTENDTYRLLKVAAGLRLIAEGLGLDGNGTDNVVSMVIPRPSTAAPAESIEQPLASQPIPPPKEITPAELSAPVPASTISAAETPTQQPLHKNAENFLNSLLGHAPEERRLVSLTQQQAEAFLDMVIGTYRRVRTGHPGEIDKRIDELRLFIQGRSNAAIVSLTQAASVGSVHQGRLNFVKTLRKNGYDPIRMRTMLDAFLQDLPQTVESSTITQEATPPGKVLCEEQVSDEQPEESSTEQSPAEKLIKLAAQYWNEADQESLAKILDNKLNNGDMPAREHIRSLMAAHAPVPGDGKVITRDEWQALKRISGFKARQGELVQRLDILRFVITDENRESYPTPEDLFSISLSKLIEAAAQDYAKGWYPPTSSTRTQSSYTAPPRTNVDPAATSRRQETHGAGNAEVLTGSKAEIQTNLRKLLERFGLEESTIEQIDIHFGLNEGALDAAKLSLGLNALRRLADSVVRRTQGWARTLGDVDSKHTLTSHEIQLMHILVGDPSTGRTAISAKTFIDRELSRVKDINAGLVYARIAGTLAKFERLSHG